MPEQATGARGTRSQPINRGALAAALLDAVHGDVLFDPGSRALYATDASNYRQLPLGVVVPRDIEGVVSAVAVCQRYGASILARGGGTSLAGQCCNDGVVLDFSRHVNHVLDIDAEQQWALVEPGVVLGDLRAAAEEHGLTFGPDPATHSHCTLGGMIGNNSCGVHSIMAGRTSDNVLELEVLTYDGVRMWSDPPPTSSIWEVDCKAIYTFTRCPASRPAPDHSVRARPRESGWRWQPGWTRRAGARTCCSPTGSTRKAISGRRRCPADGAGGRGTASVRLHLDPARRSRRPVRRNPARSRTTRSVRPTRRSSCWGRSLLPN